MSWILDMLDRKLTDTNKDAIIAMTQDFNKYYRRKWSFEKNIDYVWKWEPIGICIFIAWHDLFIHICYRNQVLKPMVLNLIDIVIGREGLEELRVEYTQWKLDESQVYILYV